MTPPRSARQSVVDGVACWLTVLLATLVVGVLFDGWSLPARATLTPAGLAPELPVLALFAVCSFVVFGLPVTLYRRLGLVGPFVVTGLYLAFFAWTVGVQLPAGVESVPVVAVLYSWTAAPAVVLVALVENGVRRFRRGSDGADEDEVRPASP